MTVTVVDAAHRTFDRVDSACDIQPNDLASVATLSWLAHAVALSLLFGVAPGSLIWLPLFLIFLTYRWGLIYGALLTLAAVSLTLITVDMKHSRWPPRLYNSWVADLMFRYFSLRIVHSQPWDTTSCHIVAGVPHGVFPGCNILWIWAYRRFFDKRALGGMAATACFRLPVYAHMLSAISAIEASEQVALSMLKENKSVGVSPGGIAEIFKCSEHEERIVLKKRFGFIRVALQTGTDVVPLYCFGQTQLMSSLSDRWGILESLSRRLRLSIIVMWGRFLLPIPRRVPVLIAIGAPLPMPRIQQPTTEDLQHHLDRYITAVQGLFDEYKHAYGWADRKLEIL